MKIARFSPCPELAPFVRQFMVVETREEATRTLLPETGIVLGFRFAGFARQLDEDPRRNLPNATLAGMRANARRMYTSADAGVVLAALHTGRAAAFFAEPLHELFGKTARLDELIAPSAIERTLDQVVTAPDHAARIASLQQLLLERLRARSADRVVSAAVSAIDSARGSVRIGELARSLDLSRDRLEKRFRLAVGSSPKQLANILRMKNAIELHRAGASLTEAALEAGYFDQSHFIRDFRLFTGEAPSRFFTTVEHC
jgi:AraC-like DNA-binding protein